MFSALSNLGSLIVFYLLHPDDWFSAWIQLDHLQPYFDNREKFAKSCNSGGLRRALEAMEDYIDKNPGALRPIVSFE